MDAVPTLARCPQYHLAHDVVMVSSRDGIHSKDDPEGCQAEQVSLNTHMRLSEFSLRHYDYVKEKVKKVGNL